MTEPTSSLTPFQQRLLPDLLAYHSDREAKGGRRSLVRRLRWLVAAAGAAAIVATGALALRPGPAFAVEDLPGGLIRITLGNAFDDPAGLQQNLRKRGVDVTVVSSRMGGCEAGRVVGVSSADNTTLPITATGDTYLLDTSALHGPLEVFVTVETGGAPVPAEQPGESVAKQPPGTVSDSSNSDGFSAIQTTGC